MRERERMVVDECSGGEPKMTDSQSQLSKKGLAAGSPSPHLGRKG